jgi:hypothetical protein
VGLIAEEAQLPPTCAPNTGNGPVDIIRAREFLSRGFQTTFIGGSGLQLLDLLLKILNPLIVLLVHFFGDLKLIPEQLTVVAWCIRLPLHSRDKKFRDRLSLPELRTFGQRSESVLRTTFLDVEGLFVGDKKIKLVSDLPLLTLFETINSVRLSGDVQCPVKNGRTTFVGSYRRRMSIFLLKKETFEQLFRTFGRLDRLLKRLEEVVSDPIDVLYLVYFLIDWHNFCLLSGELFHPLSEKPLG